MKFANNIFIIFSVVTLTFAQDEIGSLHPDVGLNIHQFLEKYGYPLESHDVTTLDGYILTMHRIPHGKDRQRKEEPKPAVLLMHGLLSSSMDWVNIGPNKSLALILADLGYDVWLGNQRGNTWSRRHETLDPNNDMIFWEFSFHEIGNYDLAAKIDYIINLTGNEKISYVGHSQGTTSYLALMASQPEYNEKITVMAALAPIAYMQNLTSPLVRLLAENQLAIDLILDVLNWHELLPHNKRIGEISNVLCIDGSPYQDLCANVLFILCGFDEPQLDRPFIPVITSNTPAGASHRQIKHYLQEINSGYFRQYDYGLFGNIASYSQTEPPMYNTSLITSPVALYYANNDYMMSLENLEQLASELPNVVKKYMVPFELFNHLDFIWALDVKTLVFDDVIALINQYNNKM